MRIIPRAEWGARHDDGAGAAPLPASEVWEHHSVSTSPGPKATYDADVLSVRRLEQIGEDRFGTGISYTWIVTQSGRIFQGHSVGRQGTHTGGRNDVARAVCLLGNYMDVRPTDAQIRAVAWLLQHAKASGWIKVAALRGGHRDVFPLTGDSIQTACPGDLAYEAIPQINKLAAGPPINTTEDDMPTADEIATAVWGKQFPGGHAQAHLTVANGNTWYLRTVADAHSGALAQILGILTAPDDDPDNAELVARLEAQITEVGVKAADAARVGAQDAVTAGISDGLEQALQADNIDQAREILRQLRDTLPTGEASR